MADDPCASHRAMRRRLRCATGEDDLTIALPMRVVKRFVNRCADLMPSPFIWAVDKCRARLADGAVKAASRAQRGRSNAKRLDLADANLTIGLDGPRDRRVDLGGICRAFLDASRSGMRARGREFHCRFAGV